VIGSSPARRNLIVNYGTIARPPALRVAGKISKTTQRPAACNALRLALPALCRRARRKTARHQRSSYLIAASYILATWSQFTKWSMKALR
jgi:hypothetical protein